MYIYEERNIEGQVLSRLNIFVGTFHTLSVPLLKFDLYNLTYTIDALDASKWISTRTMRLNNATLFFFD